MVNLVVEFVSNFKLALDEFDVILKSVPSKFKLAFPEAAVGILIFPLFPTVTLPAKVALPLVSILNLFTPACCKLIPSPFRSSISKPTDAPA